MNPAEMSPAGGEIVPDQPPGPLNLGIVLQQELLDLDVPKLVRLLLTDAVPCVKISIKFWRLLCIIHLCATAIEYSIIKTNKDDGPCITPRTISLCSILTGLISDLKRILAHKNGN